MSREVGGEVPGAAFSVCSKQEEDDVMAYESKCSTQFQGS